MINFDTLKSKRLAIWLIGLPMAIAILYYALFALNRYASMAQVVVRQSNQKDMPHIPGLASMIGGVNPISREETLYLREFITSNDMLDVLERQINWSAHYVNRWRDPVYLLRSGLSREQLLEYYRRVVTTHFDEETGLLGVEVQAFDRDFAQQTLKLILAESERFVNELSHKMAREQVRFAEQQLDEARKVYEVRRDAMLKFQSENNLLDAQAAAEARATAISDLETQLTKEQANLKGMQATLTDSSPQIRQQVIRIRALEQQINAEGKRLVSNTGKQRLNVAAADYYKLKIDAGIAEDAYKFHVSSVESARIDASKKIRSLATIVTPNMPESAIYPRRIYNLITMLMVLLFIYGIVRFIIATVEDHKD